VRLAPSERTSATTVGSVQQWSALGQLAGPPLVAAVVSAAGRLAMVTGTCSVVGLLLTVGLGRAVCATLRVKLAYSGANP
jgi:hypothetical protein